MQRLLHFDFGSLLCLLAPVALAASVVAQEPDAGATSPAPGGRLSAGIVRTQNPVLFVTQVPITRDYLTIGSSFGSHQGTARACPRGGDLWIRYPGGVLKNLTAAAGYGEPSGFQGAQAIAVREPAVHWSGTKAIFSMVVGSPVQAAAGNFRWQLYEVLGLGKNDTPVITKVAGQPSGFNNISPCYASDDRVIFASDRPRNGQAHLYPQLDEYESAPTNTGLWSLNTKTGALFLLQHSPSGSFGPFVDSFGRVLFSRWDHLERDQQADQERMGMGSYGTFNYSNEGPLAINLGHDREVFPEPRSQWITYVNQTPSYLGPPRGWESYWVGNDSNRFLPWQVFQDGTGEETLNHLGRHELRGTFQRARSDDRNLFNHYLYASPVANKKPIFNLHQIEEDPLIPGLYYGIDAPHFDTHGSGQLVALYAPLGFNANNSKVFYLTPSDTKKPSSNPSPGHIGFCRNPLRLSDGLGIVAHTANTEKEQNLGTPTQPISRFDFRLKFLVPHQSGYFLPGPTLTAGIAKTVQYYDPYQLITYSGELWELDPVEVVARQAPAPATKGLESPEAQALAAEGVTETQLRTYLKQTNRALLVVRNVTSREENDKQQPYNLRVPGGTSTVGAGGKVYDVARFQLYQGDQVRGMTGTPNPNDPPSPGRRVLAKPMHGNLPNFPLPAGAQGSVPIAADGSVAALVPTRRAMTWQLADPAGEPVVNERYWITFQPGEIRTCAACHGINERDQAGRPAPTNSPQALRYLLQYLKSIGEL